MLLSVCFLLCKLEVNNQCNQSPIESRNWNFLAFYEKVCWYNLNSIEKTVLRSNGLCRTWYYSQFGLYDNSTGVILIKSGFVTSRFPRRYVRGWFFFTIFISLWRQNLIFKQGGPSLEGTHGRHPVTVKEYAPFLFGNEKICEEQQSAKEPRMMMSICDDLLPTFRATTLSLLSGFEMFTFSRSTVVL